MGDVEAVDECPQCGSTEPWPIKRRRGRDDEVKCDCCGENIEEKGSDGNRGWMIGLRFFSFWNPKGDERILHLCSHCGWQAAKHLGFQFDTGKILSIARGEMIDGVSVYGTHGGGLGDIAMNGIGGANAPEWHAQKPDVPSAAAMERRKR
ncbi:MAG: hypothetical protein IMZ71_02625 [Chloroflexi bacterium]|nr:hypothetical protein [Chloroflexota bacterium]